MCQISAKYWQQCYSKGIHQIIARATNLPVMWCFLTTKTMLFSTHTAPSSAPPSVECEAVSSTVIQVNWGSLAPPRRNGIVRGYTVVLTDTDSRDQSSQNTSIRLATFSNLRPFHTYRCRVAAYTVALGPFSREVQATTHVDGMLTHTTSAIPSFKHCTTSFLMALPNND